MLNLFIYLFGFLRCFQHCTGHITTGSWKGRGKFVRVLYCKLLTNGKQLPTFPLEVVPETKPGPQRWEVRELPLCHCGPLVMLSIRSPKPTGLHTHDMKILVSKHCQKLDLEFGMLSTHTVISLRKKRCLTCDILELIWFWTMATLVARYCCNPIIS